MRTKVRFLNLWILHAIPSERPLRVRVGVFVHLRCMSHIRRVLDAARWVADGQMGLITAGQLREIGFNHQAVNRRIRTGGPWRRVLPGTYFLCNGAMSVDQREVAALLFAGPHSALTGCSALRRYGAQYLPGKAADRPVHVLIPQERHRKSAGFVVVERTKTPPLTRTVDGVLCTPPARAAVDAARRLTQRGDTRALLLDVVQQGLADVHELDAEKRLGQRRGTALITETIAEAMEGVLSAPEAELRELFATSTLPQPLWNPRVYLPSGQFLAQPDGLIAESMTALEVDSRDHHSAGDGWARTLDRDAEMTAAGLLVVHVVPRLMHQQPSVCMRRIRQVHEQGLRRELPVLRIVPREV